jgi:hypothetical protein
MLSNCKEKLPRFNIAILANGTIATSFVSSSPWNSIPGRKIWSDILSGKYDTCNAAHKGAALRKRANPERCPVMDYVWQYKTLSFRLA